MRQMNKMIFSFSIKENKEECLPRLLGFNVLKDKEGGLLTLENYQIMMIINSCQSVSKPC